MSSNLIARRHVLAMATGACFCRFARAQSYPDRPITFIVPNVPGGAADATVRALAHELGPRLRQQIVVENVPGGGGLLAYQRMARAAADGYTVLAANNDLITTLVTSKVPPYALKDVTPLARIGVVRMALAARADFPATSFDQLVAVAKQQPGKVTVGVTGTTSVAGIAVAMLRKLANIDLQPVAYKGGGQALVDVLGGQIDLIVTSLSVVEQHVQSGKLRMIGIVSPTRLANAPQYFALGEHPQLTGLQVDVWGGVVGPKGMPAGAISTLSAAIEAALRSPGYIESQIKRGEVQVPVLLRDEFANFLEQDEANTRRALAGLKLD